MALRCSVYPIVNSFTQADPDWDRLLQLPLSAEKAGFLRVAADAANPHSERQLQARTHLLWAKSGAAPLVLGMTI